MSHIRYRILSAVIGSISIIGATALITHFYQRAEFGNGSQDVFWAQDGAAPLIASNAARLRGSKGSSDIDVKSIVAAGARNPLNIGILHLLVMMKMQAGDNASASRIADLLLARTRRYPDIVLLKINEAIGRGDVKTALSLSDVYLRTVKLARRRPVIDGLLYLAQDAHWRDAIAGYLKERVPWRGTFLYALAQRGDINVAMALMAETGSGDLVTNEAVSEDIGDLDDEIPQGVPSQLDDGGAPTGNLPYWRVLFERLIKDGRGIDAYAMWVGLLSPTAVSSIGYIFNGSFDEPLMGVPFDWTIKATRGVDASVASKRGRNGTSALRIAFSGASVDFRHVSQELALGSGRYTLGGYVKLDNIVNARGLQWKVFCRTTAGQKLIAQSEFFSGVSEWHPFTLPFVIPEQDCVTQLLRLELPARNDFERQIEGVVLFDDFVIQKL